MLTPALDFLCVGAPRSGTTSLHYALIKHNNLALPAGKEFPFLLPRADHSQEAWERYISTHYPPRAFTPGVVTGEIIPTYWYDRSFPERLQMHFPHVKILILLRHPVDRFLSELRMRVRLGQIPWRTDRPLREQVEAVRSSEIFPKARKTLYARKYGFFPYVILASQYAQILKTYLRYVPRRNLRIFLFERLVTHPREVLGEIQTFLGVPPRITSLPKLNTAHVGWLERWLVRGYAFSYRFPRLRRGVGRMLGKRKYDVIQWFSLRNVRNTVKIQVEKEDLAYLWELFREDVRILEEAYGISTPYTNPLDR